MGQLQRQVGLRIRQLREKKGLSQEALAGICKLHRTYVGLIERGQRNLSLTVVEQIAQGLAIPASEIFQGLGQPTTVKPTRTQTGTLTLQDVGAHIKTIRQILIDSKLTDAKRYDASYKANR